MRSLMNMAIGVHELAVYIDVCTLTSMYMYMYKAYINSIQLSKPFWKELGCGVGLTKNHMPVPGVPVNHRQHITMLINTGQRPLYAGSYKSDCIDGVIAESSFRMLAAMTSLCGAARVERLPSESIDLPSPVNTTQEMCMPTNISHKTKC